MSVDTNTYGTVAGVEALIGDIVASRTFTTETTPTLAQCESELDASAAELNSLLDAYGYTVPISETGYVHAYNAMAAANNYGAAARLLGTIPVQAYDPDEAMEDMGTTRAQMYERYFNAAKSRIRKYEIRAGRRQRRFELAKSGGYADEDGNVKKPIFKRGDLDYPGTTSLTENE